MAILKERVEWRRKVASDQRYTPDLTPEEIANVRKAVRVLRARYGSHAKLASALGMKAKTVSMALVRSRKPSVALALRAARTAGVPLEDVLSGAWPKPGTCPHCGRG